MECGMAVFGYGSLILPSSLAARQDSIDLYRLYETVSDESLLHWGAVEEWFNLREEHGVEAVPVKVEGYRRYYSNHSIRGGTMLEAYPHEGEFINGILYTNLPDHLLERLQASEVGYDEEVVPPENITAYRDLDVPDDAKTGVVVNEPATEERVKRPRNELYHQRILYGIQTLEYRFSPKVAAEFRRDFLDTTYEWDDGGWRPIADPRR